ncbi:MAG: hypothetical protein K2Y28_15825 [Burkholderiaceae bacterium]|nr:hypothetical protein [Burkholderiaceae bacterium]
MKNSSAQYIYSVLRQASHEFKYLGMKCLNAAMRTPLPKVLVICIAVAIVITLLPLVFTLFVCFLLLKLLLLIVALAVRAQRHQPAQIRQTANPRQRHDD